MSAFPGRRRRTSAVAVTSSLPAQEVSAPPEDGFREECGVFGIHRYAEASNLAYLGLLAQQHRGQESAGIVSSDGRRLFDHRGMGKVFDVFDSTKIADLRGDRAIGHCRYSTAGESTARNAQPMVSGSWRGPIAVAHNGNLLRAEALRKKLEADGAIFRSTSDTEVILHLLARSTTSDLTSALREALMQVSGAYSMVMLTPARLYAVRDPHGFRPLCLGRLRQAYVVASETCAFDLIGAEYVRDVEPGEILVVDDEGCHSFRMSVAPRPSYCIFEHVYFSRPDSRVFGRGVSKTRFAMGRTLARESPVPSDVVVPIPDSGVTAALGYSRESGLPLEFGLIRNHYVGRTFIEPKQAIRNFGVKVKLNPVREILEGRRVILIDDSIVRGTTSRKIIELVRQAGAREVHFRVSSPPTISPCYYGINTPTLEELIAANQSVEEIRAFLGADSLAYLSREGLHAAVDDQGEFCAACFDRHYPVPPRGVERQPPLFQLQEGRAEP